MRVVFSLMVIAVAATTLAINGPTHAQPYYGPGMMGGYGSGYGMMGGYGGGYMMGPGYGSPQGYGPEMMYGYGPDGGSYRDGQAYRGKRLC